MLAGFIVAVPVFENVLDKGPGDATSDKDDAA
jgi:hypothetical protein